MSDNQNTELSLDSLLGNKVNSFLSVNGAEKGMPLEDAEIGEVFLSINVQNCTIEKPIIGLGLAGGLFNKVRFRSHVSEQSVHNAEAASISLTNFQHARFIDCEFEPECMVFSSSFASARFVNCKFKAFSFDTCSFHRSKYQSCIFEDCSFNGSFLEDTLFQKCTFLNCDLCLQAFDYSVFAGCDYQTSTFSLRQVFSVFGMKEILYSDGIELSNDSRIVPSEEVKKLLADIASEFNSIRQYFSALNIYIVINNSENAKKARLR